MADSSNRTGILALAQKRLSRTKTKVLQNLGKAERTTDDVFNDNVLRVERQQEVAQHLQKELKSYAHCLREMSLASKSLTTALSELYEPEWTQEPSFKSQLQSLDLLWSDFLQNVQDSVMVPIHSYLQSFPVLKAKVAKRGRKMVDYDNCRHHLEVLMATRKKDEGKLHKAKVEMKEAKRIYEELNNELRIELPEFNNSRITFCAGLLSSLFRSEHVFHSEAGKVHESLGNICQQLGKDFEQFVYQPRKALSKSVSSLSGEIDLNERVSGALSASSQLARTSVGSAVSSPYREPSQPVYGNQEVSEMKQRVSYPPSQHNGASPLWQETSYKRSSPIANHGKDGRADDRDSEHKAKGHNVYEDPKDSKKKLVDNHATDTDSDDDYISSDDEQEQPIYNNPTSDRPLTSPPPHTLFTVQATHKYMGEDVDELSFEPGEIIYVIEFDNLDEQDDGWQMGIKSSDGVHGVFPENFTQRVSAEGR